MTTNNHYNKNRIYLLYEVMSKILFDQFDSKDVILLLLIIRENLTLDILKHSNPHFDGLSSVDIANYVRALNIHIDFTYTKKKLLTFPLSKTDFNNIVFLIKFFFDKKIIDFGEISYKEFYDLFKKMNQNSNFKHKNKDFVFIKVQEIINNYSLPHALTDDSILNDIKNAIRPYYKDDFLNICKLFDFVKKDFLLSIISLLNGTIILDYNTKKQIAMIEIGSGNDNKLRLQVIVDAPHGHKIIFDYYKSQLLDLNRVHNSKISNSTDKMYSICQEYVAKRNTSNELILIPAERAFVYNSMKYQTAINTLNNSQSILNAIRAVKEFEELTKI